MQSMILGLLAETFLHPGSGRDSGLVDLPVAREAATDYPVIMGSSFKGALLDRARSYNQTAAAKVDHELAFGKQDSAGALLVSDARLLLLPVRSSTSQYKWITCPHILERLKRDCQRAGIDIPQPFGDLTVEPYQFRGVNVANNCLFLEERQFAHAGAVDVAVLPVLGRLIPHATTRSRLQAQLIVLHDDDFVWFARYGLAVNARNVLDENKTSKNLWYEETIPPDSLFYALLADRGAGTSLEVVNTLLENRSYLQVGGNETVGQGWFAVQRYQAQQ
jgi:CRISPR-associated protein Cmr4